MINDDRIFITQNNTVELAIIGRVIEEAKGKIDRIKEKLEFRDGKAKLGFTEELSISDLVEYFFEFSIQRFIFLVASDRTLTIDEDNFMKLMMFHRMGYKIIREINQLLVYEDIKEADMDSIKKFVSFPIIDSYLMLSLGSEEYSFLQKALKTTIQGFQVECESI